VLQSLRKDIVKLKKENELIAQAGIGIVGFIGWFGLASACSGVVNFFQGDFYLRAGRGGISIRVPNGPDLTRLGFVSSVLDLDVPGEEIKDWTIVQHKRAGSLSRDAGNTMAFFKLTTAGGKKYEFSLDHFREPARIIHSKILDAFQMVPADLRRPEPSRVPDESRRLEDRFDAIFSALDQLLKRVDDRGALVVAEEKTGKFVQFSTDHGELLFDLPAEALEDTELKRAVEWFGQFGVELKEYELLDAPGGRPASVGRSFQINIANDVESAARLTLEVFNSIYRLPADSPLVVDEV
jgi:hypothetical protein